MKRTNWECQVWSCIFFVFLFLFFYSWWKRTEKENHKRKELQHENLKSEMAQSGKSKRKKKTQIVAVHNTINCVQFKFNESTTIIEISWHLSAIDFLLNETHLHGFFFRAWTLRLERKSMQVIKIMILILNLITRLNFCLTLSK